MTSPNARSKPNTLIYDKKKAAAAKDAKNLTTLDAHLQEKRASQDALAEFLAKGGTVKRIPEIARVHADTEMYLNNIFTIANH